MKRLIAVGLLWTCGVASAASGRGDQEGLAAAREAIGRFAGQVDPRSLSGSVPSGGAGVVWLPCEDSGGLGVTGNGRLAV